MNIKDNKKTLFACILTTFLFTANAYAETVIRVGTWLPPSDRQNSVVWPTWAKWVEDATEGRVKVKIEDTSVHPKSMFSLVEDGVYDVSFGFHGYLPGRFQLPQIVEQPGLNAGAEAASVGLWRVHNKYFTSANEFEGLKVLAFFTHGNGTVQSNFKLDKLSDLEGRKIRVGGGIQAKLAERLGITPVAAPATKSYEMLQQKVIDGIFMNLGAQQSLRLSEVTDQITVFPEGFYMGSFSIFMNPYVFDSLSDEDKEAILSVSGEKLSALAGKMWNESDMAGLESAKRDGVSVHEVPKDSDLHKEYRELIKGLDKEWIESVDGLNVEAEAALTELRQIVQDYQSVL